MKEKITQKLVSLLILVFFLILRTEYIKLIKKDNQQLLNLRKHIFEGPRLYMFLLYYLLQYLSLQI